MVCGDVETEYLKSGQSQKIETVWFLCCLGMGETRGKEGERKRKEKRVCYVGTSTGCQPLQ